MTEQELINQIKVVQTDLGIDYFPSRGELERANKGYLCSPIGRMGGFKFENLAPSKTSLFSRGLLYIYLNGLNFFISN